MLCEDIFHLSRQQLTAQQQSSRFLGCAEVLADNQPFLRALRSEIPFLAGGSYQATCWQHELYPVFLLAFAVISRGRHLGVVLANDLIG